MKIRFFIALLILNFLNTKAQSLKLGKVSIAELEEKVFAADTTAAAVILYNKARTFLVMILKTDLALIPKLHSELKYIKKKD